jgi:uncharacterized membrane protein YbhN (UPF0104 family)
MAEPEATGRHPVLSGVRRTAYWILPVAILGFIFHKIDIAVLAETVRGADPWAYALGVLFFPLSLFLGAVRWRVLIRQYLGVAERLGFVFRQYCIGLSVSIFLPGYIGMDIYRVAVTGRRYEKYTSCIAVVLEEKIMSLVVCTGLVLGLSPWLKVRHDASVLASITDVAFAITVGGALAIGVLVVAARLAAVRDVTAFVTRKLQSVFEAMLRRIRMETSRISSLPPLIVLFEPLTRPSKLVPVVLLSGVIFVALGIANQLFLGALGHSLPFVVSLFVISVLFFVVAMPISFAGFGVREGAYILLLGMFGIPPETALVVSLFALSGTLLNYAIGGVSIYLSKSEHPERVVPPPAAG